MTVYQVVVINATGSRVQSTDIKEFASDELLEVWSRLTIEPYGEVVVTAVEMTSDAEGTIARLVCRPASSFADEAE